jgi:divalent metal cation (Fe/Co/Zn/Cd) transporter
MAGLAQIRAASQSAVCGSQMPQSKGVLWLQYITIGWMLVECGIALLAAQQAHSVTVLAFGSDSLVELLSAVVVVLQFGKRVNIERATAARLAGVLLFVLAGVVGVLAVVAFVERVPPEPSVLGVVVTGVALIAMPLLAWLKRKKAAEIGDRALAADAIQSATCAYLAAATLISLGLQLFFPVRWIDSAAALAVLPILIIEGRNAMGGAACGCCQ